MKITDMLTDLNLDLIEVSVHGAQESYFEPTAAICSTTSIFRDEEFDSAAK